MGCVIDYIKHVVQLLHDDELPSITCLAGRKWSVCALTSAQDPKGNRVQAS